MADHWQGRGSPSRSPECVRRGTGAGGSLQATGLDPYTTQEVQGLHGSHRRMRYDLQGLRENQAVMNSTLNQIRVGQDCDILEFADWCANCSAHIIVVSLTNSAVEPQASVGSATVVTAQTVTPGSISSMKTIRSSGIGRCARWAGWRRHSLCKEKRTSQKLR